GSAAARAFAAAVRPRLATAAPDEVSLLAYLAHQSPRTLDDDEIVSNALIVLFGGIETTEAAIANAVWSLLAHPVALPTALRDDASLALAIEESLRWEPAVQTCTRYVAESIVLRGVSLVPGATVQCMIGAVNRDPGVFADPDTFKVDRSNASEH